MTSERFMFSDAEEAATNLRAHAYIAERGLATSVFLATALKRPLLLEGEAGVGKTELAKVLAASLGRDLIRLQCYEGIDASQALYEWNFTRQLLTARSQGVHDGNVGDLFTPDFLIERPLLRAVRNSGSSVLLIDELDRADDEFEAFLLEILSDSAITIPEIGTIAAQDALVVVITSNRTRDLHDALKRRCVHHWIDHPDPETELAIVRMRVPELPDELAVDLVGAVQRMRTLPLGRKPGVAETIDWSQALRAIGVEGITPRAIEDTIGVLIKDEDDRREVLAHVRGEATADADE